MQSLVRVLKNQAGISLTELLVVIGILGGGALISAKLMDDQNAQQDHLKTMAAISQTVSRISSHLNNAAHCQQMLIGKTIGPALGESGTIDAKLFEISSGGNSLTLLKEGKHDFFSIPDNGVTLQNSVYGSTVADLVIDFMPTKNSSYSKAKGTITQRIPIVVERDSSNKVTACGPVLGNSTAQKELCDDLSPFTSWNSLENKCEINQSANISCPLGEVMTQMTNLGAVVCKSLQQQVGINDIFDFNPEDCSGMNPLKLTIRNSGGKLKLTCSSPD